MPGSRTPLILAKNLAAYVLGIGESAFGERHLRVLNYEIFIFRHHCRKRASNQRFNDSPHIR